MRADTDASLVARAQAGELAAFEALYRRHCARVLALCTRIAGDRVLGEDLCQEAFVQVWRKIRGFRGDSAFGTWLHRVASNVALAYLRRQPDWRLHDEWDAASAALPVTAGPGPLPIDLERAIAALPPRARSVLVLHDIEGLDHREIGARLGIAEGTCKVHLHRARQALTGKLA